MQRMTKQRASIIDLMRSRPDFLSANDVHELLKNTGQQVGIATVYRNLQALAEAKEVDVIRQEGTDTQLFRYCADDDHHHHLMCRCCGKSVDIIGDGFEKWAEEMAAKHGFTQLNHTLELYGMCNECTEHDTPHLAK